MPNPVIIVNGGAGDWKVLEKNGSALDVAESCTLYMERCRELNAGIGAATNNEGEHELDAIIADGSTLNFGSSLEE